MHELSRYAAIGIVFGVIGKELTPRVRAVVLYSELQSGQPGLRFSSTENPQPDRGVEFEDPHSDLDELMALGQIDSCRMRPTLVLVTNLRGFAWVRVEEELE